MKHPISTAELADELLRRRLIESASTTPDPSNDRPWYISVVLGFSGWLAGIFALGCIVLLFEPDSPAGFALEGLPLLLGAFGLYAADRSGAFFDQLALALSIAGQLALAWAAVDAIDSPAATAALVALMQVTLVFVMPNALAKVLATIFACCAWALTIRFAWWDPSRFSGSTHEILWIQALLGWFVVWIPIMVAVHKLIQTEREWMMSDLRRLARPALNGLLVSLAVVTLASGPNADFLFGGDVGQTGTNWIALWPLLGLGGALFAAFCAFRLRSRALIGVSIAGALLHVAQFYYFLGTTLLMKSVIMLGVGAAALVAAQWLDRRNVRNESEAS
jgi:hypothetical protein